jgi:hypothetical protein
MPIRRRPQAKSGGEDKNFIRFRDDQAKLQEIRNNLFQSQLKAGKELVFIIYEFISNTAMQTSSFEVYLLKFPQLRVLLAHRYWMRHNSAIILSRID